MNHIENAEIRELEERMIWEDRKHHLWFPLSFTKYSIGDGRLYINSGLLSSREDECLLYRVTDITLTRTLAQKIFGTGTIHMNTRDHSTPIVRLENIKNSVQVKRMISNLVEQERAQKHVAGREMYGAAGQVENPEYGYDGEEPEDFPGE